MAHSGIALQQQLLLPLLLPLAPLGRLVPKPQVSDRFGDEQRWALFQPLDELLSLGGHGHWNSTVAWLQERCLPDTLGSWLSCTPERPGQAFGQCGLGAEEMAYHRLLFAVARKDAPDLFLCNCTSPVQAAGYFLFEGPGDHYCGGATNAEYAANTIFSGVSSGQVECESRCNSEPDCSFMSFWLTGGENRCHLTKECEHMSYQPHTILVFKKTPAGQGSSLDHIRIAIATRARVVFAAYRQKHYDGYLEVGPMQQVRRWTFSEAGNVTATRPWRSTHYSSSICCESSAEALQAS